MSFTNECCSIATIIQLTNQTHSLTFLLSKLKAEATNEMYPFVLSVYYTNETLEGTRLVIEDLISFYYLTIGQKHL